MEVPSVGVSGLEILLGEGGDVELGARTSEHILVFAFDPLVSLTLSPLFVQSIIHSYLIACICALLYFILFIFICLACLCVCLTYT